MTSAEMSPMPQDDEAEHLTKQQLEQTLRFSGALIDLWGRGDAKSIDQLMKEIEAGEANITVDQDGEVTRSVRLIWLDVFAVNSQNEKLKLVEDRQMFHDGRIRRRTLNNSLGEKMKAGEEVWAAAHRALHEEIGVINAELQYVGFEQTQHTPISYPGLKSVYDTYTFKTQLSLDAFMAEGYIERQKDKTNYYHWVSIDEVQI